MKVMLSLECAEVTFLQITKIYDRSKRAVPKGFLPVVARASCPKYSDRQDFDEGDVKIS